MLSADTQNKLKDFLMAIANGELAVEKRRQSLALMQDFEPYSSFVRIDRNGDNLIDSGDVAHFLTENQRTQFSQKDCQLVVKYFDIDQDGGLNYTEFLQMILPCDDLVLRAEASQRQAGANINRYAEGERVYTSYSVERGLSDFLEQEIHLHLQLESLKYQLHSKHDWSMHNAFTTVDVTREGFLNYRNIQSFLRMNGQFATDEQVIAMVRRLDADADQIVQFPEFCELLNPAKAPPTFEGGNPFALKTVIRRNKYKTNLAESAAGRRYARSPFRSASVRKSQRSKSSKRRSTAGDSPLRAKSTSNKRPRKQTEISNKRTVSFARDPGYVVQARPALFSELPIPGSPLRPHESGGELYMGSPGPRGGSPLRAGGSPRRESPLKDLMTPARYMGPGAMNAADLSFKYKQFIGSPSQQRPFDNKSVTRHLAQASEKKKERLRYADPFDHSFNYDRRFVQRDSALYGARPSKEVASPSHPLLPKVNPLNVEDEDELITVLKEFMQHDRELEAAKVSLAQQADFNLMDAFQMIDLDSKGYVTAPQLQECLQEHGLFCHKDDVYTFVRRYDQDSDGRLLYSDFCDAFTPNTPYYANALSLRQAEFIHRNMSKFRYFQDSTRDTFIRCFRVHFEIEESIELIKQRLARRPKFNLNLAYEYLDCFSTGVVTAESLRKVLAENKCYPSDEDLICLVRRFDRNNNGRVTYQEFMDGIMPKNSLTV